MIEKRGVDKKVCAWLSVRVVHKKEKSVAINEGGALLAHSGGGCRQRRTKGVVEKVGRNSVLRKQDFGH